MSGAGPVNYRSRPSLRIAGYNSLDSLVCEAMQRLVGNGRLGYVRAQRSDGVTGQSDVHPKRKGKLVT
jgi:hypothetical protein